jgi:Holliday junction resolvase RusA-like endonuclease
MPVSAMTARGTRRVAFSVAGIAQPKGSTKAFVPAKWARVAVAQGRAPRAIVTSDNPRAKDWQHLVAAQAQTVAGDGALIFLGPVVLTVTFHLPRPATLPVKIRHHVKAPDIDKLVRLVSDSLTGILYLDDKQIVELHARKVYATRSEGPHATIALEDADPPQADLAPGEGLF